MGVVSPPFSRISSWNCVSTQTILYFLRVFVLENAVPCPLPTSRQTFHREGTVPYTSSKAVLNVLFRVPVISNPDGAIN